MATIGSAYDDPIDRLDTNFKSRKIIKAKDKLREKPFLIWDGEGARALDDNGAVIKGAPQDYILFGYYNGSEHEWITDKRLSTDDCLRLIIDCGKAHRNHIHVWFAGGYDVDMILRDMTVAQFRFLRERGYVRYANYKIKHISGKWLEVTELGDNPFKVTIYDVWGFFQSSLINALKTTISDHPLMSNLSEIESGKDKRKEFTYADLPYITKYWKIENILAHALITRLRDYLYDVGLRISKWHGPGAIASYGYRTNGIKQHKADCGSAVYDAARYAYAGGRFERFHIGRYKKAYGYDINSAYPNAIARLPSLTEGEWIHNDRPSKIVEFGLYRVSMRGPALSREPAPLFHRDKSGNITYPWRLDGWYWSPEIKALIRSMPGSKSVRITESYEYVGWTTRPFGFVKNVYNQRRQMKDDGAGAQMALKLFLNSLYGKMAQRAGWERTGEAPPWHQLEWAGWVTSYTRAMLYELMHKIPYDKLIAVETDGIYTTATPKELGIVDSKELGGWEVSYYDELIYLQSGLYAKRKDAEWSMKFRGLDSNSISINQVREHAYNLKANEDWPPLCGMTTRFVGYKNALFRETQNRGEMKDHHCVWEHEPREISCGDVGKRVHSSKICKACQQGKNAYNMPHETVIKSKTMLGFDIETLMSQRHDIPWLDDPEAAEKFKWRQMEEEMDGLISEEYA